MFAHHFRLWPLLLILAAGPIFTGCAHDLKVLNLRSYQSGSMTSPNRPLSIGIMPSDRDFESQQAIKEIGRELNKYYSEVALPYFNNGSKPVDVVAQIEIMPQYDGSGWNFLINWPGFLIWIPAWHGYNYTVTYDTEVTLLDQKQGRQIDSFRIPFEFKIRHADMNRTWTEIGWFEVGLIPFIGGFFFIGYDDNVTPLLMREVGPTISDYTAQEIISRLNNYQFPAAQP